MAISNETRLWPEVPIFILQLSSFIGRKAFVAWLYNLPSSRLFLHVPDFISYPRIYSMHLPYVEVKTAPTVVQAVNTSGVMPVLKGLGGSSGAQANGIHTLMSFL